MSSARRNMRRLIKVVRLDRNRAQPPPESSEGSKREAYVRRNEAHAVAIDQAEDLWQAGNKDSAFNVLRQARLQYGASAGLQFDYGRRAYEQGNVWAAREALHDAVELDPTHLDALNFS